MILKKVNCRNMNTKIHAFENASHFLKKPLLVDPSIEQFMPIRLGQSLFDDARSTQIGSFSNDGFRTLS